MHIFCITFKRNKNEHSILTDYLSLPDLIYDLYEH